MGLLPLGAPRLNSNGHPNYGPGTWLALLIPVGMVAAVIIVVASLYYFSQGIVDLENELIKAAKAQDHRAEAEKLANYFFDNGRKVVIGYNIEQRNSYPPVYRLITPHIDNAHPRPDGTELFIVQRTGNGYNVCPAKYVAVCDTFNKKMLELVEAADKTK